MNAEVQNIRYKIFPLLEELLSDGKLHDPLRAHDMNPHGVNGEQACVLLWQGGFPGVIKPPPLLLCEGLFRCSVTNLL